MSDRENFISAILAEPNDDLSRLAFADWLDDNGEGERDRATAEFIRLSCRMEQSERLSLAEGKWLDHGMNYAKLLPTLFAWLDKTNTRDGDMASYSYGSHFPLTWERKGRNLIIRYRRSPIYIPEICTIEFWRGFVRKVVNRHYETSDEFIRLILPDQPLCEPTLRHLEETRNRYSSSVWDSSIGMAANSFVTELPEKVKPDWSSFINGHYVHIWDAQDGDPHRWRPEKRRYFAVAWLLRKTAMMEVPSVPATKTEGAT